MFRVCAIAIGFLFGGPIGAAIAGGIVAVDAVSNGKLIQGAEKVLDAGYDALSAAGKGILNVGKAVFSKTKEAQELSGRDTKLSCSPEVDSTTKTEGKNSSPSSSKPIVGEQTAKLAQDRANQGQSAVKS